MEVLDEFSEKLTNHGLRENQPNASEKEFVRAFLIVMGLIILRESKNIDLSETEKRKGVCIILKL